MKNKGDGSIFEKQARRCLNKGDGSNYLNPKLEKGL